MEKVKEDDLQFKGHASKWDEHITTLQDNPNTWFEVKISDGNLSSFRSALHNNFGAGNYSVRASVRDSFYVKYEKD